MKTMIISALVIVLVAAVGVGAFFAGNQYGQQQANFIRTNFINQRQGGGGNPNNPSNQDGQTGAFGRPVATGTIQNITGNVVQISQPDGSTASVTVSSQTAIQKTVNGTINDLQQGERITVMGDQTGGSITARNIQLRPAAQTQ